MFSEHRRHLATYVVLHLKSAYACLQVAYGAGDQVLATAGYDQAINVWDCRANAFHALQTMSVFADSVTSVAATDR